MQKILSFLIKSHHRKLKKKIQEKSMKKGGIVEAESVCIEETDLTVLKTSLFFAGDGFTAYDAKGGVIFRVDNYDGGSAGEIVLMDRAGRCILTVRRKRPSLHQRWEGFTGERRGQKPIFSVRRSSMIGWPAAMIVQVYTDPGEEYQIEGSFACRKCTVLNSGKQVVAEIRRKTDAISNVVLGRDVFVLTVKPGFDSAFAMGLILILDQIHWTDFETDDGDAAEGGAGGVWEGAGTGADVDPTQGSKFLPARRNPRTFTRSHSL